MGTPLPILIGLVAAIKRCALASSRGRRVSPETGRDQVGKWATMPRAIPHDIIAIDHCRERPPTRPTRSGSKKGSESPSGNAASEGAIQAAAGG
jgi:hypothetical protein